MDDDKRDSIKKALLAASLAGEATRISLDELQARDHLLIWAEHNCYSFLVTDQAQMRGQLRRIARGDQVSEAVLLGARTETGRLSGTGGAELRPNTRALFVIACGQRMQRLLTSAITRMVVIKAEAALSDGDQGADHLSTGDGPAECDHRRSQSDQQTSKKIRPASAISGRILA